VQTKTAGDVQRMCKHSPTTKHQVLQPSGRMEIEI